MQLFALQNYIFNFHKELLILKYPENSLHISFLIINIFPFVKFLQNFIEILYPILKTYCGHRKHMDRPKTNVSFNPF